MPDPFDSHNLRDLIDWTGDVIAEIDEHERRLKAGKTSFRQTEAVTLRSLQAARGQLTKVSMAAATLIRKEEASDANRD